MTEEEWLSCTKPLLMPKVLRYWPNHLSEMRKCGLIACAYVLHSPAAFSSAFALQVARSCQRQLALTTPNGCMLGSIRANLLSEFPGQIAEMPYGLGLAAWDMPAAKPDTYRLNRFINGIRQPNRGSLNEVTSHCLNAVRERLRFQAAEKIEELRKECLMEAIERQKAPQTPPNRSGWGSWLAERFRSFPLVRQPHLDPRNPPGFQHAVLALLPEAERRRFAGWPWPSQQALSRISARLGALAVDTQTEVASQRMCDIVRSILGNPFRQWVVQPEWCAANFGTATRIAEHIVNTGNYADVPILADALEDAGCADEELLRHCRTGEHVPGCWVVDAVLGRN